MTPASRYGVVLLGVAAVVAAVAAADADVRSVTGRGRRASGTATVRPAPRATSAAATRRAVARPPSRAERGYASRGPYAREIAEASARYAVPERLIWAVIRVESGFDHRAVSRRGARGLMQLMPGTAAILGVRDPFDPRQNIDGGTRHLRGLMLRFRHDVRLAVAAYNAGEGPVVQHRGVPPYPETRQYVSQVLRLYEGSAEPLEPRGEGVRRIVQPGGTVVYTNLAFGGLAALAR